MTGEAVDAAGCARPAYTVQLLAAGAFVIATEGFMMAGLLPPIAQSFDRSISAAGMLVTVFALTYALSSPLLNSLVAGIARERVVVFAFALFSLCAALAGLARDLSSLIAARVFLGIAAGLYMPCASAVASSRVPPERRGRALATVHGGVTLAIAIGVPACTWLASHGTWRYAYFAIAAAGAIMTAWLLQHFGTEARVTGPAQTWTQRLSVIRQPGLFGSVIVTCCWATGIWTLYPYMGKFMADFARLAPDGVAGLLSLYGLSALGGVFLAGIAVDRFGSALVLRVGVVALALVYAGISLAAHALQGEALAIALAAALCAWGVAGFTFNPAQQANLLRLSPPHLAQVALSINGSFLYLGFALGPMLGASAWGSGHARDAGFVASGCEVLALALLIFLGAAAKRRGGADRPIKEKA